MRRRKWTENSTPPHSVTDRRQLLAHARILALLQQEMFVLAGVTSQPGEVCSVESFSNCGVNFGGFSPMPLTSQESLPLRATHQPP